MRSWGEAAHAQERMEQTAVLAALSFWDYAFVANVPGSDAYKATGRCISVAAGRISYTYGFKGKPPLAPFMGFTFYSAFGHITFTQGLKVGLIWLLLWLPYIIAVA